MEPWGARMALPVLSLLACSALGEYTGEPGAAVHGGDYPPPARGPGSEQEGATFDLRMFLENMKVDFLRNLNLSGVPSQDRTRSRATTVHDRSIQQIHHRQDVHPCVKHCAQLQRGRVESAPWERRPGRGGGLSGGFKAAARYGGHFRHGTLRFNLG